MLALGQLVPSKVLCGLSWKILAPLCKDCGEADRDSNIHLCGSWGLHCVPEEVKPAIRLLSSILTEVSKLWQPNIPVRFLLLAKCLMHPTFFQTPAHIPTKSCVIHQCCTGDYRSVASLRSHASPFTVGSLAGQPWDCGEIFPNISWSFILFPVT